MKWAVLVLWIVTVLSGFVMVRGFFRRGGLHDESLDSSYPAGLFANFSLGMASIMLWILYLITGIGALAWAAFVQFLVVVLIGTVLALPWHRARRQGHPTPKGGGIPAFGYPGMVEAAHGVFAWATVVCAAIAAS